MTTKEISFKYNIKERTLMKLCELGLFGESLIGLGRGKSRNFSEEDENIALYAKYMLYLGFSTNEINERITSAKMCKMEKHLENCITDMVLSKQAIELIPPRKYKYEPLKTVNSTTWY